MKKKISGKIIFNTAVIMICVTLILYFVFSKDGLADLLKTSGFVNPWWLLLGCVLYFGNSLMDSLLTMQFIRTRYKNVTFYESMKIAMIGHFFSAVTPSASGGQPMQIYAMAKMKIDVGFSSSILIQKFLIYQIVSTLYSLVAISMRADFILKNVEGGFMFAFVAVGLFSQLFVMTLLIIVSFCPKITKKLVKLVSFIVHKIKFFKKPDILIANIEKQVGVFHGSNSELLKNPKLLITAFIEVFIQLTLIFSVPYCILMCLNPQSNATMFDMVSSQAFVTMISSMIPLPGASGAAEYSFAVFFGIYFTPITLKSATILWRFITYYGTIIVCAPFAMITKKQREQAPKEELAQMLADETKAIESKVCPKNDISD